MRTVLGVVYASAAIATLSFGLLLVAAMDALAERLGGLSSFEVSLLLGPSLLSAAAFRKLMNGKSTKLSTGAAVLGVSLLAIVLVPDLRALSSFVARMLPVLTLTTLMSLAVRRTDLLAVFGSGVLLVLFGGAVTGTLTARLQLLDILYHPTVLLIVVLTLLTLGSLFGGAASLWMSRTRVAGAGKQT